MYAQRGHGKRSSFYSDYTFGVWREEERRPSLTPVGKAYFGFTDEELKLIDKFVRDNTVERFGPVRSVRADRELRPGVRGRLRGPAALDPPQVRRRHALPQDQPHPLGQARRRGRRHRDPGADAGGDGDGRGEPSLEPARRLDPLAGDPARRVGGQEHRELGDVVGLANAPSGVRATIWVSMSEPITPTACVPSVSTPPGAMVLTRILRAASSLAEHAGDGVERALGRRIDHACSACPVRWPPTRR